MKKKDMFIIFAILALVSLSDGLLYNFQELWMVDNLFSVKTISVIYSLCSLLTVSVIFLCSNIIKKEKLKTFVAILLLIKIICIVFLYLLYKTGMMFLIKFFIIIDYVIDIEIYTTIYPMMSIVDKNDKAYAKKDIVYNSFYYFGVLLTSFLLGKTIFIFKINYNSYLYLALIFAILSFVMTLVLNLNKYLKKASKKKNNQKLIIESLYNDIKHDKISNFYFLATVANQISYNTIFGTIILFLTTGLNMSAKSASNIYMMLGIMAVVLGAIALAKLTFKNDYINIGIKLIGRLIFYIIAFVSGIPFLAFAALAYAKITSVSYSHITEAPYINRIDKDYQLAFCNFKEMIVYLGKSVGIYLCGFLIAISWRFNFLTAAIFVFIEVLLRFKAVKLYKQEQGETK